MSTLLHEIIETSDEADAILARLEGLAIDLHDRTKRMREIQRTIHDSTPNMKQAKMPKAEATPSFTQTKTIEGQTTNGKGNGASEAA